MSEQVKAGRPDIATWQAESLRLTAFPAPVASPNEVQRWAGWSTVFGEPAPNSASKDRGQEIREEGEFEKKWLLLSRQPARIEWIYQQKLDQDLQTQPSVGSFVDSLHPFRDAMLRWLADAPPINRLAFGAVLNLPATGREETYHTLAALLPVQRLDPKTSRDFFYQINRPREYSMQVGEKITINRLSKWMSSRFAFTKFILGVDATSITQGESGFCCRLELDINTAAERQVALPKESYPDLFRELIELGVEIAKEGDVP